MHRIYKCEVEQILKLYDLTEKHFRVIVLKLLDLVVSRTGFEPVTH